jgi:hypothetical protein
MLHSLESKIAVFALVVACLFAMAKGGRAERWGAALICTSWFSSYAVSFFLSGVFSPQIRELTFLAVDAALAIGLLALAFRFAKVWLGVAMLMLSGELGLNSAAMGDWGFRFRDYIALNNILSFGLLFLLIGATVTAWVQRTRKACAVGSEASMASITTLQAGRTAVWD